MYVSDSRLGSLPNDPVMEGADFLGWFTKKTGGVRISSAADVPVKNSVYYAHYGKAEGSFMEYLKTNNIKLSDAASTTHTGTGAQETHFEYNYIGTEHWSGTPTNMHDITTVKNINGYYDGAAGIKVSLKLIEYTEYSGYADFFAQGTGHIVYTDGTEGAVFKSTEEHTHTHSNVTAATVARDFVIPAEPGKAIDHIVIDTKYDDPDDGGGGAYIIDVNRMNSVNWPSFIYPEPGLRVFSCLHVPKKSKERLLPLSFCYIRDILRSSLTHSNL